MNELTHGYMLYFFFKWGFLCLFLHISQEVDIKFKLFLGRLNSCPYRIRHVIKGKSLAKGENKWIRATGVLAKQNGTDWVEGNSYWEYFKSIKGVREHISYSGSWPSLSFSSLSYMFRSGNSWESRQMLEMSAVGPYCYSWFNQNLFWVLYSQAPCHVGCTTSSFLVCLFVFWK